MSIMAPVNPERFNSPPLQSSLECPSLPLHCRVGGLFYCSFALSGNCSDLIEHDSPQGSQLGLKIRWKLMAIFLACFSGHQNSDSTDSLDSTGPRDQTIEKSQGTI